MARTGDNETAETNRDVVDGLDRLTAKLDKLGKALESATRVTASGTRFGVHAVGAAGVGYGMYRTGRKYGFGRTAEATGSAIYGVGRAVGAAGTMMKFLRMAPQLAAAALALGAVVKILKGGTSRGSAGNQQIKHTQILASLYQQSLRQSRSLESIQAIAASNADPFNRTPAAMKSILATRGVGVTNRGALNAARLSESRARLTEASGAVESFWKTLLDPLKTRVNNARAWGYERANALVRGRGISGGAFRGGTGAAMGPLGVLWAFGAEGIRGKGNAPAINPYTSGPLGGLQERRLSQLMTYGPTVVGGPPMSARGAEGAYALGVRQQYEAEDRKAVRQWQDRVLATLEAMLMQGKPVEDELYQTQVRFGRVPRLDGVD